MPASRYVEGLRACVGHGLLLLPGVAAIVRDGDGRILVQLREGEGDWGLPGGAIDPGETPAEAIAREVHEESGLDVRVERVVGVFGGWAYRARYPNGDETEYVTIVFACAVTGGALRKQEGESAALRWVRPDELPPMKQSWERRVAEHPVGAPPLFE